MKKRSLLLVLVTALNAFAYAQQDENLKDAGKKLCTSSDPLISAENIKCHPENDYLKISNIKYHFAGDKYIILYSKADDVTKLCKAFGAERVHDFTYSPVYLPFTRGYSFQENMVTTKKSDNPAILSVTCKFSKLDKAVFPENEKEVVLLDGDFIIIKNGKEEMSDNEFNARKKKVAKSFCESNGYTDGFANTKTAPTHIWKIESGYLATKEAEFSGSFGVKLLKDGTTIREPLRSQSFHNKIKQVIETHHPVIIQQITCYKEVR